MKRMIHILLLGVLLAPLSGLAREETLEERKQRIVRKYLREKGAIEQSDLVVPDASAEEAEVKDSERFRIPETEFKPQEGAAAPLPPPRPQIRMETRNWLLDDQAAETEDPYANPFAAPDAKEGAGRDDYWTQWGGRDGVQPDAAYGTRGDNRYATPGRQTRDTSNTRYGTPRQADSGGGGYGQYGQRTPPQSGRSGGNVDIFGTPAPAATDEGLAFPGTRTTFGDTPRSGFFQTPFPTPNRRATTDPQETPKPRTTTPFYSPYDTQRRQGNGTGAARNEFIKPDPYQQWKQRTQTWDPTSDDAYVNELVRPKPR